MYRIKNFLLLTTLLFLSLSSFAQDNPTVSRTSTIEKYKGKSYFIHFVKDGETLDKIATAYNITTEIIKAENPEAQQRLYANQVLRIPVTAANEIPSAPKKEEKENRSKVEPATEPQKNIYPLENQKPAFTYFDYEVRKKETLYGISKQFGVSVDDIVAANPSNDWFPEGFLPSVHLHNNKEYKAISQRMKHCQLIQLLHKFD